MKIKWLAAVFALLSMLSGQSAFAQILINEYNPNPIGDEPTTSLVELLGPAGTSLDGYSIITIEGEGSSAGVLNGDFFDLTGITFDANGLATISGSGADLENPTGTLVLSQGFTGTPSTTGTNDGTDLDTDNDGVLDIAFPGTVVHAVSAADIATDFVYASQLGGVDMIYPSALDPTDGMGAFFDTLASDEPEIVFRDRVTGQYYQGSLDFTLLTSADGTVVADGPGGVNDIVFDATGLTGGAPNPTVIPEPASTALALVGSIALLAMRRRSRD
ncbi:MAG TPA: hypothetical protein VF175_12510 [Lacipirellula sp.]